MDRTKLIVVIGSVIFASCGIPEEQYNRDVAALKGKISASERARDELKKKLAQAKAQRADCSAALDRCNSEVAELQRQGRTLGAKVEEALRRIRELEAVAKRQRAIFDRLKASLDSLVKAGKLKISMKRGQFTLELPDKILFPEDGYKLRPEAQGALVEVTTALANLVPLRRWQVAGHADGAERAAWSVSGKRAASVVNFMLKNGMPAKYISTSGFGAFAPLTKSETEEGRALNRRIEIVLVPNLEEILAPIMEGKGG